MNHGARTSGRRVSRGTLHYRKPARLLAGPPIPIATAAAKKTAMSAGNAVFPSLVPSARRTDRRRKEVLLKKKGQTIVEKEELEHAAATADIDTWATLQPPPTSALVALGPRIGLSNVLDDSTLTQQICTHPSYLALYARYFPESPPPAHNGHLASLGNTLIGLFATEYLHSSYPHLPTRVLKAALTAYAGPLTCASISDEIGAAPLLRWWRGPPHQVSQLRHSAALASIPRAITGLVYQKRSLSAARQFVHTFFLSREVDLKSMIKFVDPKRALLETVQKFDRERPKSRLLKESGRFTNSPVFVVGVFSGIDQLGEGFGSSLKMAEYRAAEDAMHRLLLTRVPPEMMQLPSTTYGASDADEENFRPSELAEAEILYVSGGHSKMLREREAKLDKLEKFGLRG